MRYIAEIARVYHAWRGEKEAGKYKDKPGFCKVATAEEIEGHSYVLTPGRYVGASDTEDDNEMNVHIDDEGHNSGSSNEATIAKRRHKEDDDDDKDVEKELDQDIIRRSSILGSNEATIAK